MAVGPGFNSPETQAAIAKQVAEAEAAKLAQNPPETDAAAQEAAAKAAADKEAADKAAAEAAASNPPETPPEKDKPGTKESAEGTDLNMENVNEQSQEDVNKALSDAGFTNEDLGKELHENKGKLTEDTIKALKEKFDPAAVDKTVKQMEEQYTEQLPAQQEKVDKAVTDMNAYIYETLADGDATKGQDNFKILSDWAQKELPAEELAAINTLLQSGDKAVVKKGLEMAVSQWKKGKESIMMSGDAAAGAETEVKLEPLSKDQFIQIMATDKYNTDAEYAAQIDARRRKTLETEGMMTPEFSALRPPI